MGNYFAPSYLKFKEEYPKDVVGAKRFVYRNLLANKIKLNSLYQRIMTETNGDPLGVEFKHAKSQEWAYITPEMSDLNDGDFRVQKFDEKGFFTHSTCKTIEDAVELLAKDNFIEKDSGRLDLVSDSYSWRRGMASWEIINKVNQGKLSYQDGEIEFEQWKLVNPEPVVCTSKSRKMIR